MMLVNLAGQDSPVQAGKKYTFKARVYTNSDAVLGILITWYSEDQKYLGYTGPKKSTKKDEWQELLLNEKSPADAVIARCRIRVYKRGEGFGVVDEAAFY